MNRNEAGQIIAECVECGTEHLYHPETDVWLFTVSPVFCNDRCKMVHEAKLSLNLDMEDII